jgi:type II secretion system protein I
MMLRRSTNLDFGCGTGRRRAGFVMLEVLVALTILTFAVVAILNSFSKSFDATRRLEVETQAQFFARQLMDEFEVNPPPEGRHEGGFGDAYGEYWFVVEVTYETPDYDDAFRIDEVERFFPYRRMHIEVHYDNGVQKSFRAIAYETAIMGFERFSREHKSQYYIY